MNDLESWTEGLSGVSIFSLSWWGGEMLGGLGMGEDKSGREGAVLLLLLCMLYLEKTPVRSK